MLPSVIPSAPFRLTRAPRLLALPNPFVVDHLGHVLGDEGIDSPGFRALMQLELFTLPVTM